MRINVWICITDTIWTVICFGKISTTVTSIIIAAWIVRFIIAVSIWYRFKWTIITDFMWVTLHVDITFTTIPPIIVEFCSIYISMTVSVIHNSRVLTAVYYTSTEQVQMQLCLLYFLPSIHTLCNKQSWHQVHNSYHHQSHSQLYLMNLIPFSWGKVKSPRWHSQSEQILLLIQSPQQSPPSNRDLYIAKNQKLCQSQNSKWKNFAKAKYWHLF